MPVLRGPGRPDAARGARARPRDRDERPGLARACRAQPLPGVRATGGRRPRPRARRAPSQSSTTRRSRPSPKRGAQRRVAGEEDGLGYLHALVNEGRAAGASLAHSHSQLVWLDDEPPAVAAETGDAEQLAAAGRPRRRGARRRDRARPRGGKSAVRVGDPAAGRTALGRPAAAPRPRAAAARGRRAGAVERVAPPGPPRARPTPDRLRRHRARRRHLGEHGRARGRGASAAGGGRSRESAARARGSASRPRSRRRGSGPCPSPA